MLFQSECPQFPVASHRSHGLPSPRRTGTVHHRRLERVTDFAAIIGHWPLRLRSPAAPTDGGPHDWQRPIGHEGGERLR